MKYKLFVHTCDRVVFVPGNVKSFEDFDHFAEKEIGQNGYFCILCQAFRKRSKHEVMCHVESKHFPNTFSYQCEQCDMMLGTRTALTRHMQRTHPRLPDGFFVQ